MASVSEMIRKRSPFLQEESAVFQELLTFFGEKAQIAPDFHDLQEFLAPRRLYRVIKISGTSFMKCAYALVDNFPECTRALGMLRYYRSSGSIFWGDVEKAENIISNSLTMDVYGWAPDSLTVYEGEKDGKFELTAILAF